MRVLQKSGLQRHRLARLEPLVLAIGLLSLFKGLSLLQASGSHVEELSRRWGAVFAKQPALPPSPPPAARARPALPPDCRPLGPHRREFSAKELALAEERYAAWRDGSASGLAMCLVVKDQGGDLPEWLRYHQGLGAAHFYVYDTGSKPPLKAALQEFIQAGVVTYHYIDDFVAAAAEVQRSNDHRYQPKYKQWIIYSLCLRDYGKRHRWMAFIDSDEFFVLLDRTAPTLPALLERYERYGGLVANWRQLGSSGHKEHQNSTLLAYTACFPPEVGEQKLIKTIVNTAYAVQPASPHNAFYSGGCYAVGTNGARVDKVNSKDWVGDTLLVYHYVTKSEQDFREKMARGGGMGVNRRDWSYWRKVQSKATHQCTEAADAWRAMQAAGALPGRAQSRAQREGPP